MKFDVSDFVGWHAVLCGGGKDDGRLIAMIEDEGLATAWAATMARLCGAGSQFYDCDEFAVAEVKRTVTRDDKKSGLRRLSQADMN